MFFNCLLTLKYTDCLEEKKKLAYDIHTALIFLLKILLLLLTIFIWNSTTTKIK